MVVVRELVVAGLEAEGRTILVIERHGQWDVVLHIDRDPLAVDEELPDDVSPDGLLLVPGDEGRHVEGVVTERPAGDKTLSPAVPGGVPGASHGPAVAGRDLLTEGLSHDSVTGHLALLLPPADRHHGPVGPLQALDRLLGRVCSGKTRVSVKVVGHVDTEVAGHDLLVVEVEDHQGPRVIFQP